MKKFADIFICGDIINQTTDSQFVDKSIIDVIKQCDYSVCNFEGTCVSEGIVSGPMQQRPSTLRCLKEAGFNMLLLANNHITDYGYKGLEETIRQIDVFGFDRMGAGFDYGDVYAPKVLTINEMTIAIINFCEAQVGHFKSRDQKYGYAWIGDFDVDERIRTIRKDVDYLVVIPHAGLENYPIPLQQFRQLYRHWCDLGVDAVIGGHPHIAQGIEKYRDSVIFYSLGNFFFSGYKASWNSWNRGISCLLHFDNSGMRYEAIQHKMDNDQVSLCIDDINMIESNSAILADDASYSLALKEQNIRAFRDLPLRLYMSSLNGTSEHDTLLTKCKKIAYYIFNRPSLYSKSENYRMSVLKRLTENETYRFLTISAIEDMLNK